ncbi:MAG TPA: TonB-dependent receptor [Allosphingosinicella sp.]
MVSTAWGISMIALSAGMAAPAFAQEAPSSASNAQAGTSEPAPADPNEAEPGGLEDIVVYGTKKVEGERLQDVPIAVTAVSAEMLEAAHTVDIRDVGRLVPNAQLDGVGTFPGFANFFMRGVGVSTSVRSLDPAVNIVQDGMVIGYQAGAVLDTFDSEGIEVLRGPQGVLFGRNASGGVVNLRSKRPTGRFEAGVKVTIGNEHTIETRSAIEGTIVEDRVFARLAVLTRNNDGFFTNTNHGTFVVVPSNANPTGAAAAQHPVRDVPKTDEVVVKSTWVFKLSDTTRFTLLGQYLNFDDGGGATRSFYIPGTPLRQHQTVWGWTPSQEKWAVNLGTPGYTKIKGYHLIGELEQEIGTGTLTAIGSYRDVSYDATLNVGGDPFDTLLFPDNEEDSDQTSFEARYNVGLGDRIDLLVGAFYFDLNANVFEKRLQKLATSATLRRYTVNIWDQSTKSYAAFGNVDFRITPELTLSAGIRYSKDKKRMHVIPLTICPGQSFDSCPRNFLDAEKSWDDISPRVVANYKVTRDIMIYGGYSRGYRAGNFNARAPTAGGAVTPADPETVSSIEVGVKSDLLDNKLRVNIGYFNQKYDDIQRLVQFAVPGESPNQQLFNAAAATIQGIEIETSALPFPGLRLDANIGYTDAKYDSFNNLTGLPVGADPTDLEFDRVPKWTVYLGANYDHDFGVDQKVSLHAGYSWRSHVFTDVLNTPFLEQDAYGLFDASASYTRGRYSVSVFGRNIFNKEYAEIKSAGIGYNEFGGSPRYYGVEFGVEF